MEHIWEATPDDILYVILEMVIEGFADILILTQVCTQYQTILQRLLPVMHSSESILNRTGYFYRNVLSRHEAGLFAFWSLLRFGKARPMWHGYHNSLPRYTRPEDDCVYYCQNCKIPVLKSADILSTNYHGASGPAFLVKGMINIMMMPEPYDTVFTTGQYTVQDFRCEGCQSLLGKKYINADEVSNRFKVNKFLLEQAKIILPTCCAEKHTTVKAVPGICTSCQHQSLNATSNAILVLTNNLTDLRQVSLLQRAFDRETRLLKKIFESAANMNRLELSNVLDSVGTRLGMMATYQDLERGYMYELVQFTRHVASFTRLPNVQISPHDSSGFCLLFPVGRQLCTTLATSISFFASVKIVWEIRADGPPALVPQVLSLVQHICDHRGFDDEIQETLLQECGYFDANPEARCFEETSGIKRVFLGAKQRVARIFRRVLPQSCSRLSVSTAATISDNV